MLKQPSQSQLSPWGPCFSGFLWVALLAGCAGQVSPDASSSPEIASVNQRIAALENEVAQLKLELAHRQAGASMQLSTESELDDPDGVKVYLDPPGGWFRMDRKTGKLSAVPDAQPAGFELMVPTTQRPGGDLIQESSPPDANP